MHLHFSIFLGAIVRGQLTNHAKEHHKKALNSINRTRNVDVFAPEIADIANTA